MITDGEFWFELRRQRGRAECLFQGMLTLLHTRQCTLDAHTSTLEEEEAAWIVPQAPEDVAAGESRSTPSKKKKAARKKYADDEGAEKDHSTREGFALPGVARHPVAPITMRVLQHVLMFAIPIYPLRYSIPAMSMSWNTSCFIDRISKQLVTFGAGEGVNVPQHLHSRGCIAGDGFFAILTDRDEVWASGGLHVAGSSAVGATALGNLQTMAGVAGKVLMLAGHGERLVAVTRAFAVRPLSVLSTKIKSIMPPRRVRFLDLGFGEEVYMVGVDSVVYKSTASTQRVGTPRRIMTMSRTPVSRVASGTSFLLMINQSGHLCSLGRNRKGQLGMGSTQETRRKPYFHRNLRHHFFVQVAAGDCHSLALTSSGVVYVAGSNEKGQLGLGAQVKSLAIFTALPLPSKCIGIAAGPVGSMFACDDSRVYACGLNNYLQLGVESTEKVVYRPAPLPALRSGVESYTMDFGGYSLRESSAKDFEDNTSPQWARSPAAPPQKGASGDTQLPQKEGLKGSAPRVPTSNGAPADCPSPLPCTDSKWKGSEPLKEGSGHVMEREPAFLVDARSNESPVQPSAELGNGTATVEKVDQCSSCCVMM